MPKANTPGCTKQACLFRDEYEKFTEKGYKVYGCSKDSPKSMLNWKTKYDFQYDLLSDPNQLLIKAVGAKDGDKTTRSHVVVGQDGICLDIVIKVSPGDSSSKAFEAIV